MDCADAAWTSNRAPRKLTIWRMDFWGWGDDDARWCRALLVVGGVLSGAFGDDFFDGLVPEVPVGAVVFADEDAEETFCGVGHGMVGSFCGEEEGGEFHFIGAIEGVGGKDFEEARGELSILEVGEQFFEIVVGDEVCDVLSGCGLSVGGHGRNFL